MRSYEIVFIVKTGSESERAKIVEWVKGLLKGLAITKEEDLGSKALAYKIRGELSGHYYHVIAEGDIMPSDFDKKILENEQVLRHLVLKK